MHFLDERPYKGKLCPRIEFGIDFGSVLARQVAHSALWFYTPPPRQEQALVA
jgi:hypothetical protein